MTDIAALVERLRERHPFHPIYVEAADALEACQAERNGVRAILASTDIVSLPNDYPLTRMAQDRMERIKELTLQGLAEIGRAEKAEAEVERLRADSLLHRKLYAEEARAKMVMAEEHSKAIARAEKAERMREGLTFARDALAGYPQSVYRDVHLAEINAVLAGDKP